LTALPGEKKGNLFRHLTLFLLFALTAWQENLPTTIGATMGTGMMRQSGPSALRTSYQLRQLEAMMRSSIALARARDALFW
jgi:hypothetical protein